MDDFFKNNREVISKWIQVGVLAMIPLQIIYAITTYIQAQPYQLNIFILLMTISNCALCVTIYISNKNFDTLHKITKEQSQLLKVKRMYND